MGLNSFGVKHMKWSILAHSPGPWWEPKAFTLPSPLLGASVSHTPLWEARRRTTENEESNIERDDYMWEKKKNLTFLHTKESCWLIALGNTQVVL